MVDIEDIHQKTEADALRHAIEKELASRDMLYFTKWTMPNFKPMDFHKTYYRVLDYFAEGKIKKLIVSVPPQHGKSEGSTRRMVSYLLGRDPHKKIAVASYAASLARKFNREIQRIIDSPEYNEIFPETVLNRSNVVTISDQALRNSEEFEIVGKRGGLKAVGRGGGLTGTPVDIAVLDDIYKDAMEANSPIIREAAWEWYTSVCDTRLHNDSQQLIVFTRWHEDDLIGRLEKSDTVVEVKTWADIESLSGLDDVWVKINFEALKETAPTELDPRIIGQALWPERHNEEKLLRARKRDPMVFESLYQGNPKPVKGLLYSGFKTYSKLPEEGFRAIRNYTDTADQGDDYLCSVVYGEGFDDKAYVLDVLYTQEAMEKTEEWTAQQFDRLKVDEADIESNNGGRGFARNVQKLVKGYTNVNWFHQSKNKEARILTNAGRVQKEIVFPDDWSARWPAFYSDITSFRRKYAANKKRDGADTLTGIVEKMEEGTTIGPISFVV